MLGTAGKVLSSALMGRVGERMYSLAFEGLPHICVCIVTASFHLEVEGMHDKVLILGSMMLCWAFEWEGKGTIRGFKNSYSFAYACSFVDPQSPEMRCWAALKCQHWSCVG